MDKMDLSLIVGFCTSLLALLYITAAFLLPDATHFYEGILYIQ